MKNIKQPANTDTALDKGLSLVARRVAAEFEREHEKDVHRTLSQRPRLRHLPGLN